MKWPDALLEPQGKRETQSQSLGAWDNSSASDTTLEVATPSSPGGGTPFLTLNLCA